MRDVVKEIKYDDVYSEMSKYRKNMCYDCKYLQDRICTKKRYVRTCARKGLKNKA